MDGYLGNQKEYSELEVGRDEFELVPIAGEMKVGVLELRFREMATDVKIRTEFDGLNKNRGARVSRRNARK